MEILHDALSLGVKLREWFPNENGMCTLCNTYEESMTHLFAECEVVKKFLKRVCDSFAIPITTGEVGLPINWINQVNKLQFYLLGICRKVIWDLRNIAKYKGLKPDAKSFTLNFKLMLRSHLENLYNVYLLRNEENKFRESYTFANVCTLHENKRRIDIRI